MNKKKELTVNNPNLDQKFRLSSLQSVPVPG